MNPQIKVKCQAELGELLVESDRVLKSRYHKDGDCIVDQKNDGWVDPQDFAKWVTGCRNLCRLLGQTAQVWSEEFSGEIVNKYATAVKLRGSLTALREAVDRDLLTSLEDLVAADAFASLLDQADELYEKKYLLAAGVLGRAVLEEHIRKKCIRCGVLPAGRPTISELNQTLYKCGDIDKLAMQQVTSMATAGNHCAHNLPPPLSKAQVRRLIDDVRDFVARHPL
jgi:hypothetical protein